MNLPIIELSLEKLDVATLTGGMEVNILIGECYPAWVAALFVPKEGDFFIRAPKDITWAQLLTHLQCFPSASQARKNNWNKDIPPGWSEISIGRARRLFIYVLKGN